MYDCKGISIHYTQTGQNPHKWYDVPRLRLGAVDDLEYVIDQYRLNGEGLLEMIRLKSEERPTYIIDNHNHALYCWVEALREIKPQNRVVVLRFDSHADHSKFGADPVPVRDRQLRPQKRHVHEASPSVEPVARHGQQCGRCQGQ